MKNHARTVRILIGVVLLFLTFTASNCADERVTNNTSALDEQAQTEINQRELLKKQPPPRVTWSMERDNLIKKNRLFNDRTVSFFIYVFNEGVADPIGFYQVNKVSSVDSQLTNTAQIVSVAGTDHRFEVLPSPSEDGSYGTNGDGVFGFTPEDVFLQTNMHYIAATIPLTFQHPVIRIGIVSTDEAKKLLDASKKVMYKDDSNGK